MADGRRVEPLVHQPKRLALLAYLAVAQPRGAQRRDRLVALFWPESSPSHARAALSQAIYTIRSTLGDGAVRSRGDDEVILDSDVVSCDALTFERALDSGRPADALALYRGDFLDGFFITGAPEFERWVDEERARLRHRAGEGAWTMAGAMASQRNVVEAVRWARQAAALLPADEATARRLMTFLAGLGDRAAALRAYEAFAWRLSADYDAEPSAETQALAARIRSEQADEPAPRAARTGEALTPAVAPPREPDRPTDERTNVASGGRARRAAAAVVAALLLVAVGRVLRPGTPARGPVMRFPLEFEGAPPLASGVGGSTIVLSPAGDQLVYLGTVGQSTQLFLRAMDKLQALPIPHTEGARHASFSPDGRWIAFVAGNAIRRVRVDGGPAVTVCTLSETVAGASWGGGRGGGGGATGGRGRGDFIVFAAPSGLWRVPVSGGAPSILARADTGRGVRYRWPEVLPDGRTVVFTRVEKTGMELASVSVDGDTVTALGVEGTNPHFAAPGYLVFARMDGALLAARFDASRGGITGSAFPIAEGVWVGSAGAAKLGVSRSGTFAYVPETHDNTLALVTRSGRVDSIPVPARAYTAVAFSPDGRRIATVIRTIEEHQDIWIVEPTQARVTRLTFDTGSVSPVWTPDGRQIVFASMSAGRHVGFALRAIAADGVGRRSLLGPSIGQLPQAVTADGGSLVFQREHPQTGQDLWILPLRGGSTPRPYLRSPADEKTPTLSPDGRWIAYSSNQSGRDEIYIAGFPEPGTPMPVSSGGGWEPRWAASGREIFYRSAAGMMAVRIDGGSRPRAGRSEMLFADAAYLSWRRTPAYDVHPDGQHFAMIRRGADAQRIIVVLNWPDAVELSPRW